MHKEERHDESNLKQRTADQMVCIDGGVVDSDLF